jgi:hypothetical protein
MKKRKKIRREKPVDRHLDIPAEANRDKHVNFLAQETGETDPATEPDSGRLLNRDREQKRKRNRID